jgi:phosphopantothenoylcysteine synthetase/decarboxylase
LFCRIGRSPKDVVLYTDEDEWSSWKKIGDSVLHIELRRWADILVIAPLSANTLGKVMYVFEQFQKHFSFIFNFYQLATRRYG